MSLPFALRISTGSGSDSRTIVSDNLASLAKVVRWAIEYGAAQMYIAPAAEDTTSSLDWNELVKEFPRCKRRVLLTKPDFPKLRLDDAKIFEDQLTGLFYATSIMDKALAM